MQITFDTTNPHDLSILDSLFKNLNRSAVVAEAQPEVASNTGTTATGSTFLPEGGGVTGAAQEAAPAPVKEKKVKAKAVEAAPVEEPVAVEKAVVEPETAPQSDKPLSLDEVRAALQQFTATKGVPAGIELLKTFDAGRISELVAGKYAEFVEACAA